MQSFAEAAYALKVARAKVEGTMSIKAIVRPTLRRIHVNAQGYTRNGTYKGVGECLYQCLFEEPDGRVIYFERRAASRDAAKDLCRAAYPQYEMRFGR